MLAFRVAWYVLTFLNKAHIQCLPRSSRLLAGICDPNNDNATIFESGAIVSYVNARSVKSSTLAFQSSSMVCQSQQWSYFQASTQAPYVQLATWHAPHSSTLHVVKPIPPNQTFSRSPGSQTNAFTVKFGASLTFSNTISTTMEWFHHDMQQSTLTFDISSRIYKPQATRTRPFLARTEASVLTLSRPH